MFLRYLRQLSVFLSSRYIATFVATQTHAIFPPHALTRLLPSCLILIPIRKLMELHLNYRDMGEAGWELNVLQLTESIL